MLPVHYLEPITLVFHCLRLDNWLAVVVAVNLRMFLGSLVYKEQYYIWFLGDRVSNLIKRFLEVPVMCDGKRDRERVKANQKFILETLFLEGQQNFKN